jgi:uncharacterized protein YecE (DUF72 family)
MQSVGVARAKLLEGTGTHSSVIKVGTSGFSYPEWRGPFYPEKLSQQQMLAYYSQHFPAVEINSTYYHIPPARNMAAMAKRAEGRLDFAVKTHQDMTHAREKYADALPLFREALEPLREADCLGCVLVQFPFSFKATAANADFGKKNVKAVLDTLVAVGHKELKKTGVFMIPGFAKMIVVKKPARKARKGINPFTKLEQMFAAKPARKVVKARPMKALKDAVA